MTMWERYRAKLLPGAYQLFKWGILDCKADDFVVDPERVGGNGETVLLKFRNKEAAEYEAQKRNMTMTYGDL
jgi:nitrous oxide reductase accessory protein NosL